jgi:phage baseplate assembly protein W
MATFQGAPYPITKHARGFLHTQTGADLIRSDLLSLLLTNPGERVMLPEFGTPLIELIFEQNDAVVAEQAREMITNAIATWEPRIAVTAIETNVGVEDSLDVNDPRDDVPHILFIRIEFTDFDDITQLEELKLEVPLGGA